jgi:hypothetical protein
VVLEGEVELRVVELRVVELRVDGGRVGRVELAVRVVVLVGWAVWRGGRRVVRRRRRRVGGDMAVWVVVCVVLSAEKVFWCDGGEVEFCRRRERGEGRNDCIYCRR